MRWKDKIIISALVLLLAFLGVVGINSFDVRALQNEKITDKSSKPPRKPIAAPELHVKIPKFTVYKIPNLVGKSIDDGINRIKELYPNINIVVQSEDGENIEKYNLTASILQQTPDTYSFDKPIKITFIIEKNNTPETFQDIDWNSKYYTYSADPNKGSRNVCDKNNNIAWPYSRCGDIDMSFKPGKGWNKMICSSYGSSRFWEVNFPNDPYPLDRTWIIDLSNKTTTQSGKFKVSHNIEDIREHSIISISFAKGNHIGFIEEIQEDGTIVVTEANVGTGESTYGWRRWEGKSIQDWISSYKNGKLNGYLYPEIID